MEGKELGQSQYNLRALLWAVIAVCITFTGCMRWGQPLLSRAVIQYDSNVLKSDKELLLLNIVRMHDDQPPHFTAASAITAAFIFTSSGGLGGGGANTWQTSDGTTFGGLTLSATTTNSPTISIAPMQGKEFAQRLLKPIDIEFANTLLLQQGQQIDKMLRLIGHSFLMKGKTETERVLALIPDKSAPEAAVCKKPVPDLDEYLKSAGCDTSKPDCLLTNRPTINDCLVRESKGRKDINHYQLFRQVVLHIKAVQLSGSMAFSQLCFDLPVKGTLRTAKELSAKDFKDTIDALERQYRWETTEERQETKPSTEKEGFILSDKSTPGVKVKGTFKSADDLKGKDMKNIIDALEKQYYWKKTSAPEPEKQEEKFILTKRSTITALTDFDFEKELCDQNKEALRKQIFEDLQLSDYLKFNQGVVIILLRGDKEKSRWPIYGLFRLRNFRQVLKFLGESAGESPELEREYEREYYVPPSPFTECLLNKKKDKLLPSPLDNPDLTVTVHSRKPKPGTILLPQRVSKDPPVDPLVDIDYNGKIYWISSPQDQTKQEPPKTDLEKRYPPRWNKQVFEMLYEIFQMNRVEPPVSAPSLTLPVK